MVKVKQDLLNSIKEFTLMDDPFMTKVFEDDIEAHAINIADYFRK